MKVRVRIQRNYSNKVTAIEVANDGELWGVDDIGRLVDEINWNQLSQFQLRVYGALLTVGAGSTISYRDLGALSGFPNAARAVGRAMATNPFAIAIPCHRVVASNGTLGGYAWGAVVKQQLLDFETKSSNNT